MRPDPLGLGALLLVGAEWAVLGWLGGVAWPAAAWWAPRWSLRLLIGALLVALAELGLAALGPGFGNRLLVLVVAAVLAGLVRLVARPSRQRSAAQPGPRELIGWIGLAVVLGAALVRSWLVPEAGWDAYSHWGLKAQAYATLGTIVDTQTVHEDYPPLVPLLEAWLYGHLGRIAIDQAKLVWALLGSACVVCLGWHLRSLLRTCWLAPYVAIAILLASTGLLDDFWTGQADLPLTAFLSLACLAALQWQRAPHRAWLVQMGLFSAAAVLTKFEGLPRIGVLVAALALEWVLGRVARSHRPAVYPLAIVVSGGSAALAWAGWLGFRLAHGLPGSTEHLSQFQPGAIGAVALALVAVFAGVRTGGALLVAGLAWVVAGRRVLAPEWRLLSLVVLGQLAGTLLAFLMSETAPAVEVQTSATRLFEQFLPLGLVAGAVWLEQKYL